MQSIGAPNATRSRTFFLGLTLSLAATAFSLVIGEFAARIAFRDVTTTADNTSYFARRWQKTVRTNAWGFREQDFDPLKPAGVYRIAVIGDSLTYGQGIDETDRVTNVLQRRLHSRSEVLNFGRPGAETIDHLRILTDVVLPASPDFVLLQWFTNDVEGHDKSGRPRPLRLVPSDSLVWRLQSTSVLFYLLNKQWFTIQRDLGWVSTYEEYMVARFGNPHSPSSIEATEALQKFIRICKEREVPVGIILFTMSYVHDAPLAFLTERVLELCRRETVTCLDMRGTLSPYDGDPKLWASRLDPHPGPLAHRLAADRLLETFRDVWAGR